MTAYFHSPFKQKSAVYKKLQTSGLWSFIGIHKKVEIAKHVATTTCNKMITQPATFKGIPNIPAQRFLLYAPYQHLALACWNICHARLVDVSFLTITHYKEDTIHYLVEYLEKFGYMAYRSLIFPDIYLHTLRSHHRWL